MLAVLCAWIPAGAGEVRVEGRTFSLPDGFEVERVAGPPLVDRPIEADFDERGRLYVSDSSGSNAPPKQQLVERTHRIMRLVDLDGDGRYDRSTVFADRMMFPEGVLWADGSLYVAAPPSIWKLTDTDDDGVADLREEWFQGKTLNGCANDLHGPYPGPDGWIYWAKGAFEQQTYERPDGPPFVTKASHLFRRRLDGRGFIEPVMTGGMDNPVGVAFTPGGERIFTTTFFQHPGGGHRDGLIHAVYGGVYGKVHAVIDGHTRTGPDVMPVLTHLGPAAPCGPGLLRVGRLRRGVPRQPLRRAVQHAEDLAARPRARRGDLRDPRRGLPRRQGYRPRLPPDRRLRRRRRQPARDRHRRLVQALLPDLAARQARRPRARSIASDARAPRRSTTRAA